MYNKRTFLADPFIPSTSSLVCYCGTPAFHDKDRVGILQKTVSISDCHSTIRLHQIDIENDQQFIDKIERLIEGLEDYVKYLKIHQTN